MNIYTYTCIHTYICIHTYVYTYTGLRLSILGCARCYMIYVYTFVHICQYICTYIHICQYMYMHTSTSLRLSILALHARVAIWYTYIYTRANRMYIHMSCSKCIYIIHLANVYICNVRIAYSNVYIYVCMYKCI